MQTRTIDGNSIARDLRAGLSRRAATLAASGVRPGLAVVRVGDHPASSVYVRNKIAACRDAGIYSQDIHLPDTPDETALLGQVGILNEDPRIHGVRVQLPLPRGFSAERVQEAVSPMKDVDGFHPTNVGLLSTGHPRFVPCTPLGIMKLLQHEGVDPE